MKELGARSTQIQCLMGLSGLALRHGPSYSFFSQIRSITISPGMHFGIAEFVKASTPDFKATERMENKDWVPVLEKCTVQWSRAVGKARKENKVFHPGNSDISLDFFCFVLL